MKCSAEGCEKEVMGRGLCSMHYARMRKYGDLNTVKKPQIHGATVKERYEHYVVKGSGCWDWSGSKDVRGYGRLNVNNVPELVHRLSWAFHCGPIPEGEQVLHKCDNPPCSNPEHLFLGNHADNVADMWSKGRARPKVHHGQEHGMAKLTDEQIYEIRESVGPSHITAEKYGMSGRQVRAIRNRESWKHLPERQLNDCHQSS